MDHQAPVEAITIAHVGIAVSSIEDALGFWVGVLGGRLVDRSVAGGDVLADVMGAHDTMVDVAIIEIGGRRIELLDYREPRGVMPDAAQPFHRGAMHLALDAGDPVSVIARAADHGFHPLGHVGPEGRPVRSSLYLAGPDRIFVEIRQG